MSSQIEEQLAEEDSCIQILLPTETAETQEVQGADVAILAAFGAWITKLEHGEVLLHVGGKVIAHHHVMLLVSMARKAHREIREKERKRERKNELESGVLTRQLHSR